MKTPVHIIIANELNVAGIIAVLSAKKRSVMKYSRVTFGPVSKEDQLQLVANSHLTGIAYSKEDVEQNYNKSVEIYHSYILTHTKITLPELVEFERTRRSLTAEECVKYGIADEIFTGH